MVKKKVSKKRVSKRNTKKVSKKNSSVRKSGFRTEKDIAVDFATKVHKLFNHMVKATILFGSQVKNNTKPGSDIDIVIIVDDAGVNWDMELTAWYREELGKLIASQDYSQDLHVNTIRLTTWWDDLMHGDPVIINILRNGEALIDIAGFFNPIKSLLIQGRIHSTPEAVFNALQRAPRHMAQSKIAVLSSIEGIYWSMVDSAQAALITLGKLPPSPEHVTAMLKEQFVDRDLMSIDYVKWYRDIYTLHKGIAHGEIREMKGQSIDEWQDRAEKFMKKMADLIDKIIDARKDI